MLLGAHVKAPPCKVLQVYNPDTLGHPDQALQAKYWKQYTTSLASAPYKIQGKI